MDAASVGKRPTERLDPTSHLCLRLFLLLILCVVVPDWMNGVQVCALSLDRDGESQPQIEHVTVVEGGTLILECVVPPGNLQQLWWGKQLKNESWLAGNGVVYTADSRLSTDTRTDQQLGVFFLQLRDTVTSDAGRYICYAIWNDTTSAKGFFDISVISFPSVDPVCSTNDTSPTAVSCDTSNGTPQVDIVWTSEETGEVFPGRTRKYTLKKLKHVRSVLTLEPELLGHVLVCTVTSSAFPGQNRTCVVSSVLNTSSFTEQPSSYSTNDIHQTTVERSERTAPGSSPFFSLGPTPEEQIFRAMLPAVIAVPMLTIVLLLLGICIWKRRRGRRNKKAGDTSADDELEGRNSENACSPLCQTTQLCSEINDRSEAASREGAPAGRNSPSAPGKVAVDPATGSVAWCRKSAPKRHSHHAYEIVTPNDSDSDIDSVGPPVSPHVYERVNDDISGLVKADNDSQCRGTDNNDNQEHGTTSSESDENEVMIKNPIYEPYDKN